MGGGLMQLVAYGAQDIYLTGNPQITFFKVVYRRHTNFSMESIQQIFDGNATYGNRASATISRNGDLLYRLYLEHDAHITTTSGNHDIAACCDYGNHVMKECELQIGGQRIDKHYGHWNSVYSQLAGGFQHAGSRDNLFNRMSGNGMGHNNITDVSGTHQGYQGWDHSDSDNFLKGKFWIPLHFWFCRNPGLALPLIALQYHEVKLIIQFEDIGQVAIQGQDDNQGNSNSKSFIDANPAGFGPDETDFQLWADYIYLDTDERRRFAQVSHEYLIEQVQHQEVPCNGAMVLNFNHPVKKLIWSGTRALTPGTASDPTRTNVNGQGQAHGRDTYQRRKIHNAHSDTYHLTLNGHERFAPRNYTYFTTTQIWQHHSGRDMEINRISGNTKELDNLNTDTIAVYSFALKPEEHQPSGTCNFSRIDNAQLIKSGSAVLEPVASGETQGIVNLNIYAVNYNVLRIMSGMGGLAYSN